jgi:preprotein translocase subunit SecF
MNWHHAVETYRGHTVPHFRLIPRRRLWYTVSGILILLSLAGLVFRGLNLSIDFEGGALLSYPAKTAETAAAVTNVLAPFGRGDAEVQIVNGNEIQVRTSTLTTMSDVQRTQMIDALAKQAGISASEISREDVGPTWGSEISRKALTGLIVVLICISLYIALRFEPKMAIGAQVAMLHDVIITAGVYALTGREVTPATVIAILTILGFSLYDTVVIFDKIQENTEMGGAVARDGYAAVVNRSMNQVFMRSVNTSLVVLLPILSLLLFGGDTLKDFAFAMFVGVLSGAYSSIFIAAPIVVDLKEREPRYRQLRARAEAREAALAVSGAAAGASPPKSAAKKPSSSSGQARAGGSSSSGGARRPSGGKRKGKRKPPAKRKRR